MQYLKSCAQLNLYLHWTNFGDDKYSLKNGWNLKGELKGQRELQVPQNLPKMFLSQKQPARILLLQLCSNSVMLPKSLLYYGKGDRGGWQKVISCKFPLKNVPCIFMSSFAISSVALPGKVEDEIAACHLFSEPASK